MWSLGCILGEMLLGQWKSKCFYFQAAVTICPVASVTIIFCVQYFVTLMAAT